MMIDTIAAVRSIGELVHQYGPRGEHPEHTRADWRAEVAALCTVAGYWDWVVRKLTRHLVWNEDIDCASPVAAQEADNPD